MLIDNIIPQYTRQCFAQAHVDTRADSALMQNRGLPVLAFRPQRNTHHVLTNRPTTVE